MATVSHRERHKASYLTHESAVRRRGELRGIIRQHRVAVTGGMLTMSVPSWSPIKAWQNAHKCDDNRARSRAERELAAIEERYPTPEPWQPRKSTAADKRIAKQYDAEATPMHELCEAIGIANEIRSKHFYFEDDDYPMAQEDAAALAECGIVVHPEHDDTDRADHWQPDESHWSRVDEQMRKVA